MDFHNDPSFFEIAVWVALFAILFCLLYLAMMVTVYHI